VTKSTRTGAIVAAAAGVAAAALAVAFTMPGATAAPETGTILSSDNAQVVKGSYIVKLKDAKAGKSRVASSASSLTDRFGGKVSRTYSSALKGFALKATEAEAKRLAADPSVAYVEADAKVHTTAVGSWGLDRSDQRDLPLDDTYTAPNDGSGVTAFIIDTGIRTSHSEFGGRATIGTDTVGDGQNGQDCNGHGTHVSGTVGGTTYGLAKNVNLVGVRVLDCGGSGTFEGVIAGIDWVTANHSGPSVANMSLGGGAFQAVDDAVANSIASGVVYAIAAGNSSADACNFSPARTPEAITVGATQIDDAQASFSNFGSCLDIYGPGVDITSSWNTDDSATNTISGTSMATPHVAGAAALILSANPTATPQAVRDQMVANGTPDHVGNPGAGSPNVLLFVGEGSAC
jgi:subtilisin family serine protease